MDELTKLREFRADTSPPDDEHLTAGAGRLVTQIRGDGRAGRRLAGGRLLRMTVATGARRAVLAGLTAAAVTAGVVVAVPGGDSAGRPHALTVAEILDAAATNAAAAPGKEPGAHQWLYTRDYGCWASCRTTEDWFRYDGNQDAFLDPEAKGVHVLINDFGALNEPGANRYVEGPGARPQETRRRMAELPMEPHALLKALRDDPYFADVRTKFGSLPASSPMAAFDRVVALLSLTVPAPPKLTAALYRSLAYIPGVHLLAKPMKDIAGRPGLAVEAVSVQGKPTTTAHSYLILDPKTYAYRGKRLEVRESDTRIPKQNRSWSVSSAQLAYVVVDHPGQRPGGPVPPPSSITVRDFAHDG
ncbi:CU044_5270 family protein [Actinacidiphila acidipaludis]|uniref:CU044_5270 family protein n=1 Tax=Actinacidiphila acidipaludis TaxID=2873382 RepID=A0ABS7Q9Z2_9ACTN|nr:CU044_5270 family protein [Streptomyces acidipaludis]MBY8879544.1 CU044_5270 family protein [Streptomyces acidipaludis]